MKYPPENRGIEATGHNQLQNTKLEDNMRHIFCARAHFHLVAKQSQRQRGPYDTMSLV